MERLLIQQWFDNGGTEAALSEQYGITARHGIKYPQLGVNAGSPPSV